MEEKWHLAKETHLPAQGLIAYEYTSNTDGSVPLEPVEVKDKKQKTKTWIRGITTSSSGNRRIVQNAGSMISDMMVSASNTANRGAPTIITAHSSQLHTSVFKQPKGPFQGGNHLKLQAL